jgi:putative tricarboxylic transport membrane protein
MAAVFGVLGYILKRLSMPSVPIVLGMVLGGIMEVKLRAGMARVKEPLDFIDRPVAFILFLIIIVVLAIHVRRVLLDRKEVKEAEWQTKNSSTRFGRLMLRRRNSFLKDRGKVVRARHSKLLRRLTGLF